MGWEETVAGYGRPQHLINQDLDQCDLFIGMIWKRWGTPPGSDGQYTSGFQEEFERSLARREHSDRPEISLFFKNIPDEYMDDPGNDLKRVLQFKEEITKEKKILYQKFSEVKDMEGLARKSITKFVNSVKAKDEASGSDDDRVKRDEPKSETLQSEKLSPADSPLSAEGQVFLEKLVNRFSQERALDDLSSSDIARFRLLANSISKPGNEDLNLGVHDANILFSAYIEGMKLGRREIRLLTRLGFQNLANENVPLWRWYKAISVSQHDFAFVSSLTRRSEQEKIGAIRVLDALSRDLPDNNSLLQKKWLINVWFSDDSSTAVKSAALSYLAKKGTAEDYFIAKKEYDKNEHGTSLPALESMIRILIRTGQENSAQLLVLKSQFESLNSDIMQEVLNGFDNLDRETLLLGLEHRNAQIRLRTLNALLSRDALDQNMLERLLEDNDASVRHSAIVGLEKFGRAFTEEEVKGILVKPQEQPKYSLLGAFTTNDTDKKGENVFALYQLERLKNLPEEELTRKIEVSHIHFDDEYFARAERYFSKYVAELRRDIDDTFNTYFELRIQRMKTVFRDLPDSHTVVNSTKGFQDVIRKNLTRRGLDLLCSKGKTEDLKRIRDNIQSGYTGTSIADLEYMRKRGEWADIPLLVNADASIFGRSFGLTDHIDFQNKVAESLLDLGRGHSISSLLSLEIPAAILIMTIQHCSDSRFAKISDDVLLGLFDHESENVRKAISIKAVRALSAKRIRLLLDEYVFSDKYRYYNVIHWLDLGASMPRDEARKVALAFSS